MVFEASSSDAIAQFRSEPEYVALNAFETTEVKTAITNEEVAKRIKARYP
jgi:hypothetical protein